ncbi:MAG: twin-arginine translocation signal domain-containing protein [Planctomycetes bacterium]|nr:twin-arginine translocation signal domain-containing protein [Planctomycetota bacterium]
MNDHDLLNRISRRRFLQRGTMGLGMLAMPR